MSKTELEMAGSIAESKPDSEDLQLGATVGDGFREGPSGTPLYPCPIKHPTELHPGDHILFQTAEPPFRPVYQSALVSGGEKESVEIVSYSRAGIYEDCVRFGTLRGLHRVEYVPDCRYSAGKSVSRAKWRLKMGEDRYHALHNNSHFLATWAKTGKEYLLYGIINGLTCEEGVCYPLNPVLSQATISCLSDVSPGDHVISGSQHYLVESTDKRSFTAYTTQGGKACKETKKWSQAGDLVVGVDYDQHSNVYHPGNALEAASRELEQQKTKWEFSDCFVSAMKCGRGHVVNERCLLRRDVEPVGCTRVTPHVAVDVGDHLIVRNPFGEYCEYRSVLVYSCINENTVVSMPTLRGKEPMGRLCLADYGEVYRVNYPQSLPVGEILRRCCSPEGERMLMEEGADPSCFVSWAKTGRPVSVNVPKLLSRPQMVQIRPSEYEKILSPDEIKAGDHLFVPNLAFRWHFMVTAIVPNNHAECLFSVIYNLRGMVEESQERIDPSDDDVFRVMYPEEYPPPVAVKRARSLLGQVKLGPTARMWFVRWAKTGSEEGLEIDFLKRKSLPVSKSKVVCFSQLDPGDYLVEDKGRFYVRRHYIVTSVESATACSVIGAWKGRVQESRLTLDDCVTVYHRLMYEEGVCVCSSEVIRRAREAVSASKSKLFTDRRKFVNYIKTTDSFEVDVENLPDYRTLLQRERVESVRDLKPGDHLEEPVKGLQGLSYRDMIVTATVSDRNVMVLRLAPQDGKQRLVETELDLGDASELYRVKYLEKVDIGEGIEALRRVKKGKPLSNAKTNHILMLATIGEAASVQVDPQMHKVLQCYKEDNHRPHPESRMRSESIRAGAKASVDIAFRFGSRVLLHGSTLGRIVGFGPGLHILSETPFFALKIYQLNRQKKFDQITKEDYKRGVIQQSFTSANTVIGATAGAIIGQVAIPVPIVGAAVGGVLGSIGGNGIGRLGGWAASKLVSDERVPTLPVIVPFLFLDYPEE